MKEVLVSLLALSAGAMLVSAADLKIPIEKYQLKNGMRVVLSPDPSTPVVTVYMIYNVGARSEERGRTGFAHLFEHMMFQGSKNAPKGVHDQIVEGNGGFLNGSTHPDFTDYFEVLPSNKLPLALWLESDRMRGLDITGENLTNQKEAVKQERRLNFDNRPYNTAIVDKWPEIAFRNWSSAHSLIGSFDDLNAAKVEDVEKFFKTYYAPNNSILAIVGDIRTDETKKLIETYFGDIPPQTQPKGPDLTEPAQTKPVFETYSDAMAQVPATVLGYPGPARRSPDYYALAMLDMVLTGGDSSRFQLNLVKGKQSVIQYEANLGWPFAGPSDYKDPGQYAMLLLHKPDFTAKQIVGQVQEEIAKIQKNGVDLKELNRARALLRSNRISELQNSRNRARLLAQYELFDRKPEFVNTEIAEFLAVTPQRIQAVAAKYLVPGKQTVLAIVPGPPGANEKKEAE